MEQKTKISSKAEFNLFKMVMYGVLFCAVGILLNLAGSRVASYFKLPLYLDSIGTVLVAVTTGLLPGVIVGFLSNVINALSDPINAYYALTSVFIAAAATWWAGKGWCNKVGQARFLTIPLSLIGGGIGSVLTYCLYGFDIGQGFTAPLSMHFFEQGNGSLFFSQLLSDLLYDVPDKVITVVVAFILFKLLTSRITGLAHIHGWRQKPLNDKEYDEAVHEFGQSAKSLRTKLLLIVSILLIMIFFVTAVIAYKLYDAATKEDHIKMGTGAANLVASVIPGDRIDEFIRLGEDADGYREIEKQLEQIKTTSEEIMYVYCYQILEDGCHVVFDLDTEDTPGGNPGDIVEFDEAFMPYIDDLFAGRRIEPIESDETFGWLITMYEPIYDSNGNCKAYACVDISMNKVRLREISFITKIVALFFAFLVVIMALGLWFADYNLILPINTMARAADRFANRMEENRDVSVNHFKSLDIHTGDEIQNLYHAFSMTIEETVRYIADIQEKSAEINKMQNGLILVLADMVESRDESTGAHVRKTAAYCRIILEHLRQNGEFTDIITDDYINDVFNSAPLHDIGKISVPDAILNKPGKLTDEEYEIMKTHTTAGKNIIQQAIEQVATDAGYLREARNLAAYHHEKWDGTGYPEGLSGDAIPLSARVMAVADVFDALISARVYKPSFDYTRAFDIIEKGSGSHFDPRVAKAFMEARDEAEIIAEEFSEMHTGMITQEAIERAAKSRAERKAETA